MMLNSGDNHMRKHCIQCRSYQEEPKGKDKEVN